MKKKTYAIICGMFDVIHPGYIKMFREADEFFDGVIVCLNRMDNPEKYNKLPAILSLEERKDTLQAIKHINEILLYSNEEELKELLLYLQSDESRDYVRFLGEDYKDKRFTGDDLGMQVYYHNRDHGWSTTKFKSQIAKSYSTPNI